MNGLFLELIKGSLNKVLQGELTLWRFGLQWVCTTRRAEASLKLQHRWILKLLSLSASFTDEGIYIQFKKADLEKSTIYSAMDLTATCSFPKRSNKIFPKEIFFIEKTSSTWISQRRKGLVVLQVGINLHKPHACFSRWLFPDTLLNK